MLVVEWLSSRPFTFGKCEQVLGQPECKDREAELNRGMNCQKKQVQRSEVALSFN